MKTNPIATDRLYLPIKWTAYQIAANYGKDSKKIERLRSYCKALPNTKKYFTIVQYDDGILANVPNCRIFAAGGVGTDPIPLVCDEHELQGFKKKYLATFLGSIGTHPIRKLMQDKLKGVEGFTVENVETSKKNVQNFVNVTEQSYFALCPRGYGKTSFRLYEAMQLGAVPVYISDEHWIPFDKYIDWREFALCVFPDQIGELPGMLQDIMDSGKYSIMRAKALYAYRRYFAYDGCYSMIKQMVEEEYENDKRKA